VNWPDQTDMLTDIRFFENLFDDRGLRHVCPCDRDEQIVLFDTSSGSFVSGRGINMSDPAQVKLVSVDVLSADKNWATA
jgi:hypothetical protein